MTVLRQLALEVLAGASEICSECRMLGEAMEVEDDDLRELCVEGLRVCVNKLHLMLDQLMREVG